MKKLLFLVLVIGSFVLGGLYFTGNMRVTSRGIKFGATKQSKNTNVDADKVLKDLGNAKDAIANGVSNAYDKAKDTLNSDKMKEAQKKLQQYIDSGKKLGTEEYNKLKKEYDKYSKLAKKNFGNNKEKK